MKKLSFWVHAVLISVLCAFVASCGGGGGGGGEVAASLRVVNVHTSDKSTQSVYEGNALEDFYVYADITGDLTKLNGRTVYVGFEDPNQLFRFAGLNLGTNGTYNQITLWPLSTTGRKGTYTQPMRISVCLDAACQEPFAGSPFEVAVHFEILEGIRFGIPSPLTIDTEFGAAVPSTSIPVVLPSGISDFRLDESGVEVWDCCDVAPGNSILVTIPDLPIGIHHKSLAVSTYGLQSVFMDVTVNVRPAADGKQVSFQPKSISAVSSRSGIDHVGIPGLITSADGDLQTQLSRIVYLRPNGSGNLDAGGFPWLNMFCCNAYNNISREFGVFINAVREVPGGFERLPVGRYDAEIYFMNGAGVEIATPFKVSMTVTD